MREITFCPNNKWIITGASGYIGKAFIKMLTDREMESGFQTGSILEFIEDCRCVIHLGASVSPDLDSLSSNLYTDIALIKLLNQHSVPLVYASGNNVYPFKSNCDQDEYSINDCYSASKIFGEQIVEYFFKNPYVLLRIGDVFGPAQKHGNFFKNIEKSLTERTALKLYGQGLKTRSFVYIDELVSMLLFCIDNINNLDRTKLNLFNPAHANIHSILQYIADKTGIGIETVSYELQHEINDHRTLKMNFPNAYSYKFSTLWHALDHYIETIYKGQL